MDESQASLPSDTPKPDNNLNSISTSPSDVASTLKSLQLGKATGPYAINNRILKELATPLSFPLSDLFNFSLATGKVHQMFKKENPSVVSNYRPISFLSAVGKVLEKIVHKHLFNFVREHELLSALHAAHCVCRVLVSASS